jgi:hypothetical protein
MQVTMIFFESTLVNPINHCDVSPKVCVNESPRIYSDLGTFNGCRYPGNEDLEIADTDHNGIYYFLSK